MIDFTRMWSSMDEKQWNKTYLTDKIARVRSRRRTFLWYNISCQMIQNRLQNLLTSKI